MIREQQANIDLQCELQAQVQKSATVQANLEKVEVKTVVRDDAQIQEDAKLKIEELESLVEYHLTINDKLHA